MNQQEQDARSPDAEMAPPRCVYFHYVTPTRSPLLHHHGYVETYVMQESAICPGDRLEDLIPVWAQRVKKRELEPVGWAFGDVRWRRRSYLVVVLNAPGLKFASAEALDIAGGTATKFGKKTLMNFTTADGTAMQSIHCLNHFRKQDGTSLGDRDRDDFYPLRLAFTSVPLAVSDPVESFTHDDSGTNMGPERP